MEFKNLAEVTQLEEVPEGASVLAATAEGEVVRVPGDGLGGGGGALLVTFTTTDGQTVTADKTYAEIESAYNNGVFVRGMLLMEIGGTVARNEFPFIGFSGGFAMFCFTAMTSNESVMTQKLSISTEDAISIDNYFANLA